MPLDPPPGWKDLAEALQNLLVRLQTYDAATMSWVPLQTPFQMAEAVYTTRVASSGGFTYIGKSTPGADETDPVWRVYRIDADGNTLFADGVSDFTKRWSLKDTYTYL